MTETKESYTRTPDEIRSLVIHYNNEAASGKLGLDELAKHLTGLAGELYQTGETNEALQVSTLGVQALLTSENQNAAKAQIVGIREQGENLKVHRLGVKQAGESMEAAGTAMKSAADGNAYSAEIMQKSAIRISEAMQKRPGN